MKTLTVISGKGGTGKTSIVASFASLANNKILADCDVDAANLHLLLHPEVKKSFNFKGGKLAIIDKEKCTKCGKCEKICQFEAIKDFTVDPISCEGCSLCMHICPVSAIKIQEKITGWVYVSDTKYGPMVHAKLGIAEGNSGKLVTQVRTTAEEVAREKGAEIILIDGSPGIGCPVIASLTGADLALIVTEPTLSGISDLERVGEVCNHFNIPWVVCINKFDINEENTAKIQAECNQRGIKVVGKIPFDVNFIHALVNNIPLIEYSSNKSSSEVKKMWEEILDILIKYKKHS
ncbi:ATP-binding protein [Candidatus Aerophobetes bacterium]|nr:ATP-binding protein [Candidatus Aerophobetes bacterium]